MESDGSSAAPSTLVESSNNGMQSVGDKKAASHARCLIVAIVSEAKGKTIRMMKKTRGCADLENRRELACEVESQCPNGTAKQLY